MAETKQDIRYIGAVLAESWRERTLRVSEEGQFIVNMEEKLLSGKKLTAGQESLLRAIWDAEMEAIWKERLKEYRDATKH